MSIWEILIIAVALAADAFAVSVCFGLSMSKVTVKKALIVGLYFGIFQAVMPLIGYFLAGLFADKIMAFDHWIVFALLCFIGGKMIFESFKKEEVKTEEVSLSPKKMLPLALATSIDAMAAGITFAFLDANIALSVSVIGVITLALSMLGVKIGSIFGVKFKSKAELIGGIILVLMGVKIVIEHMI